MNKNMTRALEACSNNGREHMILDGDSIITQLPGPYDAPLMQSVNLNDKTVVVSTVAPFGTDEDTFWSVAEFLLDVNQSIAIGSFFIQKGDGVIGFRSGIYIGDQVLDGDELRYHLNMGAFAFGRYGREIENRALAGTPTKGVQSELMYR